MKIDVDAFLNSLPIMGVGLLGIFIVTIVIIVGIYILKGCTPQKNEDDKKETDDAKENDKSEVKKESAMDLMKEREKKDFLKEETSNYISHDL